MDRTRIKSNNRQDEILRIQKKKNNFVMLDKGFLENEDLSYKAKGILAYLLSKPDNWKVIVKDLVNRSKDGQDSIYSGLKELKLTGYYSKIPIRNKNGTIIHWESTIYEDPAENPEINPLRDFPEMGETLENSPLRDFPDMGKPDMANPQRNKNYYNNNKYNNNKHQSVSQSITVQPPAYKTDKTDTTKDKPYNNSTNIGYSVPYKEYSAYKTAIKKNIEYDYHKPQHKRFINSFVDIMAKFCTTKTPDTVKINGADIPIDIVKDTYLKLKFEHIELAVERYTEQYHEITNKAGYIRTMLFNVYNELEPHYINQARVDGMVKP